MDQAGQLAPVAGLSDSFLALEARTSTSLHPSLSVWTTRVGTHPPDRRTVVMAKLDSERSFGMTLEQQRAVAPDDYPRVSFVFPRSAASRAGIKSGWSLEAINGASCLGCSVRHVASIFRDLQQVTLQIDASTEMPTALPTTLPTAAATSDAPSVSVFTTVAAATIVTAVSAPTMAASTQITAISTAMPAQLPVTTIAVTTAPPPNATSLPVPVTTALNSANAPSALTVPSTPTAHQPLQYALPRASVSEPTMNGVERHLKASVANSSPWQAVGAAPTAGWAVVTSTSPHSSTKLPVPQTSDAAGKTPAPPAVIPSRLVAVTESSGLLPQSQVPPVLLGSTPTASRAAPISNGISGGATPIVAPSVLTATTNHRATAGTPVALPVQAQASVTAPPPTAGGNATMIDDSRDGRNSLATVALRAAPSTAVVPLSTAASVAATAPQVSIITVPQVPSSTALACSQSKLQSLPAASPREPVILPATISTPTQMYEPILAPSVQPVQASVTVPMLSAAPPAEVASNGVSVAPKVSQPPQPSLQPSGRLGSAIPASQPQSPRGSAAKKRARAQSDHRVATPAAQLTTKQKRGRGGKRRNSAAAAGWDSDDEIYVFGSDVEPMSGEDEVAAKPKEGRNRRYSTRQSESGGRARRSLTVSRLVTMGFKQEDAEASVEACGDDPDKCMVWIVSHLEEKQYINDMNQASIESELSKREEAEELKKQQVETLKKATAFTSLFQTSYILCEQSEAPRLKSMLASTIGSIEADSLMRTLLTKLLTVEAKAIKWYKGATKCYMLQLAARLESAFESHDALTCCAKRLATEPVTSGCAFVRLLHEEEVTLSHVLYFMPENQGGVPLAFLHADESMQFSLDDDGFEVVELPSTASQDDS